METKFLELKKDPEGAIAEAAADGLQAEAVAKIFAAKGRPADNPLILHIADPEQIHALTTGLNANARALMETFWPGPLTIVVPRSAVVPDIVTAGLDTVAVRMPSHPVAAALIRAAGCPIAAPSANVSGKPSPTNAKDVAEDMTGKVAAILDGGSCGIGVESTVVDTTSPVPTILRPGGITREMLEDRLGAVEIDPALNGDPALRPRAPGMKYRHYAPKAPLYLYEGEQAALRLTEAVQRSQKLGLHVGVLCDDAVKTRLEESLRRGHRAEILSWGLGKPDLAEHLYELLRDFDRVSPDFIIGMGVDEKGLGLAVMNRLRKAAGYQILQAEDNTIVIKSGSGFPDLLLTMKE